MFLGQLACEAVNFALKRLIKEERPRLLQLQASSTFAAPGKGYGMPSSHAQFAAFWAVALTLFLLVRHRPHHHYHHHHHDPYPAGDDGRSRSRSSSSRVEDDDDDNQRGDEVAPSLLTDVPRAYRDGGLPALSACVEAYAHAPWTLAQRGLASAGALAVAALVAWSRVYLGYHTVRQVLVGCAAGAASAGGWFAVTWMLRETGLLAWALELPLARWFRVRDLVVGEDLCQAGWEKWERRRRQAVLERERGKEKKKA
ncbi:hypothetical protein VTK56DRAFT_669 [Thermocarpiscus australiensis]